MKISLNTLTKVTKCILVICSNRWGIHEDVFVRYLILVGSHNDALWLDNPTVDEVMAISKRCDADVITEAVQAPCPFCQSREGTDPNSIQ